MTSRAWGLLTVEASDLQFGGNLGYEDVLGEKYLWNNTVANGKAVQPGDLVLLRGKKLALGIAWVDEITTGPGKKVQQRCPQCRSTAIKPRKSAKYSSVPFRCSESPCGASFRDPVVEVLDVTIYEADYGRTWRPFDRPVLISRIKPFFLNNSGQQSIRPMNLDGLRAELGTESGLGPTWWKADAGLRPAIPGGHKLILQKARIGQQEFRQALLARYGSRCAISGPQPEESLEAAHLYRYADTPHHDLAGGLLLRRDLHALMDRGLLAIDPATWTVKVAPRLHCYKELAVLHGQALSISPADRPNVSYLAVHHDLAIETW
ncbi:HNH endonuclease signature motif containing protein [Nonomuraea wenchangensis]